jgi:hypothetical protein
MAGDCVEVIARHRGRPGFVVMVLNTEWLENWRVKLAYSPKVIALLQAKPGDAGTPERGDGLHPWDGSPASRERAEEWAETLARMAQSERERRASNAHGG